MTSPPAPRGPLIGAALAGFVLAAAIAAVLVATGAVGTTESSGAGRSTAAVSLPDRLGSYLRFADVPVNRSERARATVTRIRTSDEATRRELAKAYDGAGAAVQTYGDRDLQTVVAAWVVRAPTPRPVVTVTDAKDLGLALAPRYVVHGTHTDCVVYTDPTPAGRTPAANSIHASYCQRSAGSLTVQVQVSTGGVDPKTAAALTDTLWDAVSG